MPGRVGAAMSAIERPVPGDGWLLITAIQQGKSGAYFADLVTGCSGTPGMTWLSSFVPRGTCLEPLPRN